MEIFQLDLEGMLLFLSIINYYKSKRSKYNKI